MPYTDILMLVLGVAFFSNGARADGKPPALWGSLSMLAWVITFLVFGGGWIRWLVGQLVLYAALFAWNLRGGRPKAPTADRR